MHEVLELLYLWLKAGHIIFVVFWMAGLFVAPRQLIYMQDVAPGSSEEAIWITRTRLLAKVILIPSIVLVWVFGLGLAFAVDAWSQPWFHAKLLFVLLLSGYHGWIASLARKMARGERPISPRTLKMWGEAPAIAMVLIVVLVVVKPF